MALRPLAEFSQPREQWFALWGPPPAPSPSLLFCALYARPGGDEATWASIISHAAELRERYPLARILLAGDANVHLSYVVDHDQPCTCLHCRQRAADRAIEAALEAAGLRAFNPVAPTHISGHSIDLVLGARGRAVPVRVQPDYVGGSDHKLVLADVPCTLAAPLCLGFGRVFWASGAEWEGGLLEDSSLLDHLAALVEGAADTPALKPDWFGGVATRAERRALVDVAAWARDAVYALTGHAVGATKALRKPAGARAGGRTPLNPASFADHMAYKHAVDVALWETRRQAVSRYVHLRSVSPAAAEKFLSGYFPGAARFPVQLVDPSTAASLSPTELGRRRRKRFDGSSAERFSRGRGRSGPS